MRLQAFSQLRKIIDASFFPLLYLPIRPYIVRILLLIRRLRINALQQNLIVLANPLTSRLIRMLIRSLQSMPIRVRGLQFQIFLASPFLNIIVRRPAFQLSSITLVLRIQLKTAIKTFIIVSQLSLLLSQRSDLYSSIGIPSQPRDFLLQAALIAVRTSFLIIYQSILRFLLSRIISPQRFRIASQSLENVVFLLYNLEQNIPAILRIPLVISACLLSLSLSALILVLEKVLFLLQKPFKGDSLRS